MCADLYTFDRLAAVPCVPTQKLEHYADWATTGHNALVTTKCKLFSALRIGLASRYQGADARLSTFETLTFALALTFGSFQMVSEST